MAISDIFTPGWTTSKPGDMKYGAGLETKFSRPSPIASTVEDFKREYLTSPIGPAISPEAHERVKATMAKASLDFAELSAKGLTTAAGAISYDKVANSSLTAEAINNSIMAAEAMRAAPKIDRDTPEGAIDAW